MTPPPAAGAPSRAPLVAAWCFLALVVAAEAAAATLGRGTWWGLHAWGFLPLPALALAAALAPLVAWLAGAPGAPRGASAAPRKAGALLPAALALASLVPFWAWRSRTILLGDGLPLTLELPVEFGLHPREPLAGALQHGVWAAFGGLFSGSGTPQYRAVWDAVALGSCLAGAAFVAVAWWLAREVACPRGGEAPDGRLRALAFLVLVTQGYVQLCFGYVENYTFGLLAVSLFLATGLAALRGRLPLAAPLAAAALMVAMHFALAALAPALAVAAIAALRDPARRRGAARDLALALAALVAARWLLLERFGWRLEGAIGALAASGRGAWGYLLSPAHLRDFLSEHVLVGPVGLLALLPALALLRRPWRARTLFVLAAALPAALACWMVPDLPLGYARDWDLFAPFGLAFAAAALTLVAGACDARTGARAAAVLLAASLFHTAPWIAVNASSARSLRRFETLPLGLGRTESSIAYWHYVQGDRAAAKSWLRLSLDAYPSNNRAHALFGEIFLEERRPALAVEAFRAAVASRPDLARYRRRLTESLLLAGDEAGALESARALAAADPAGVQSVVLLALIEARHGDRAAARAALAAAAARVPGEPLFRYLDRQLAAPAWSPGDSLLWWNFALGRAAAGAAPADAGGR